MNHTIIDGKLYRFGHLRVSPGSFYVIEIFDGTKFVVRDTPEGVAVFNEMMDTTIRMVVALDTKVSTT